MMNFNLIDFYKQINKTSKNCHLVAYILKKERVLGYLISLFNIPTVLTDKIIWKILSNWCVLLMILTMQIIHVHAHANANLAYMSVIGYNFAKRYRTFTPFYCTYE